MLLLLLACQPADLAWTSSPAGSVDRPADTGQVQDTGDSGDTGDTGGANTGDTGDSGDTGGQDTGGDTGDTAEPHLVTVYVTRHCEKETGSDPGLTEQGAERALALAERLVDVPLDAVYATAFRRTQETVQPTADQHGLEVITDVEPEQELPELILGSQAGEVILHAGHSFTIPDFMENIGAEDAPGLSGYGQLWILTVADGEVTGVALEHYGD